jgi:hypothetical protein
MVQTGRGPQTCAACEGSGRHYDPGLDFHYELGPILLTAPNVVPPTVGGNGGAIIGFSTNVLDNDFRARMISAVSTAPFTLLLKDSKNKRPFANQQIHVNNFCGTAQLPFPLLTPYVFHRLAPILVDVTDLGGPAATAYAGGATYNPGAIVTNGGVYYIALVTTTGNAPPNAAYWAVYTNTIRIALHGEEINPE